MKPVVFLGRSLDDLREFRPAARRAMGFQIERLQYGLEPNDWKPMASVGPGVREIRVREADGAWRVVYVARFAEAVYVLHAFEKKARSTPERDLEIARSRLKALMRGPAGTAEGERR